LGQGSRWKEIVAANPGIDPKKLKPGTRLVMPPRQAAADKR
jgi:hypothetical protein